MDIHAYVGTFSKVMRLWTISILNHFTETTGTHELSLLTIENQMNLELKQEPRVTFYSNKKHDGNITLQLGSK